jgi:hypothetical protein|tara:strand:- start:1182 stop:1322 length:141 start_codon:yes stop_codon:yes gene_type:complete
MSKLTVELDEQDVEELFDWVRQVTDNQEQILIKMDALINAVTDETR